MLLWEQDRLQLYSQIPLVRATSYSFVIGLSFKGLNIVIDMFRAVRKHRFYHWTKEMLEEYHHTMELRMLGTRLVMTDEPENIRAIQDTQVTSSHGMENNYAI